jgi:hypothetical protein
VRGGPRAVFFGARDARACGGCFTPPEETESVITDEKMILSISMSQTTLYDEIEYTGSPASFAWVLPIKGTVTVGLSADVLFETLEQLTATQVLQPTYTCPVPPSCDDVFDDGEGDDSAADDSSSDDSGGDPVTVTSQAQVGPYETVQLHSTDGSALNNWLTAHGYQIPASTQPIIDAYVSEGFDFLALKLVPGVGVQAMQPVRVTSQGAAPSLPLHMVAVGTGATTGITIWIVADSRWEPQNFPTFTIADSEIAWDWVTESSNYESLRLAKEATFGGRGWQIESSLELNQSTVLQTLQGAVEYGPTTGSYTAAAAPDAGAPDAGSADGGAEDAGDDAEGDGGASVAAAEADMAVLFAGIAQPNARFTRMRSDVAKSALSVDMALQASADQSELTNVHTPGQQIGEPVCPVYDDDCEVVGSAPGGGTVDGGTALPGADVGGGAAGGSGCTTSGPPGPAEPMGTTAGVLVALAAVSVVRARAKRRAARLAK